MRSLILLTFCLLVGMAVAMTGHAAERPSLVLILADDLGYGDLSCYGARDLQTPHIDRLFAEGLRFDNFYANCPVCSPTRAALLTGRYPELVGVPGVIRTRPEDNWGYLDPGAVMLPSLLQRAGYHTALVGKWHLGLESPNTPLDRGFDHFHGFLGDMMDDYYDHRRHGINYMRRGPEEIDPKGHATDLFSTWACDYLRERARQEAPFCLYLAYNAPHVPIQPPPEWLARVQARHPDLPEQRAKLVALIEHLDAGVGQVLGCLDELGLRERTVVIFSSDNGGELPAGASNGPLRDGKQSMYEGGLKVCTSVRWPGVTSAGSRTDFRAMSMDLFPTFCDAVGVPIPHAIEGRSLLPTLRGEPQAELRQDWFFTRREGNNRYGGKTIDAVLRGDWKLLQNSPFSPLELYNLREDPREEHDRSRTAPRVFNELSAALRRQIQRSGQVPWQRPEPVPAE